MPTVIIINATAEAAEAPFTVSREHLPIALSCSGLAGAETVAIQFLTGTTFSTVDDADGAVTLTATRKQRSIEAPGRYKVVKPTTVGATLVQIDY